MDAFCLGKVAFPAAPSHPWHSSPDPVLPWQCCNIPFPMSSEECSGCLNLPSPLSQHLDCHPKMFSFFILLSFIMHRMPVTHKPLCLHTPACSLLQLIGDFPMRVPVACDRGITTTLRQLDNLANCHPQTWGTRQSGLGMEGPYGRMPLIEGKSRKIRTVVGMGVWDWGLHTLPLDCHPSMPEYIHIRGSGSGTPPLRRRLRTLTARVGTD